MKLADLTWGALALVAISTGLRAQGGPDAPFQIPAIREPHHFVKLDNKYVRVLDVTVPGYDSTLYHIHENPYFWVSIGAATLRGNNVNTPEVFPIEKKDGEVTWSSAVSHRVANIVATAFHNITVQIQGRDDVSPGTNFAATPRPQGYQATVPLDNQVVHVERLILEPGESTGAYTLPKSGILIAVRDGRLSISSASGSARAVTMRAGDFEWHTGPLTHTVTNVGSARFEAIEAVWK